MRQVKWLYARTASNDAVAINAKYVKDIAIDGDQSLHIGFSTAAGGAGVVQMTCDATDGEERAILLYLARKIASSREPVMVVADDVTSEYIHEDISAVGTITPSS